MPTPTATAHIWLDETGRAWIDETGYKVSLLAQQHLTLSWSAEMLHENHPDLSLAQIHAALAFYYDRREEFEEQFDQSESRAAGLRAGMGDSDLQKRMAKLKRLR